jgi:hypothetical protein
MEFLLLLIPRAKFQKQIHQLSRYKISFKIALEPYKLECR